MLKHEVTTTEQANDCILCKMTYLVINKIATKESSTTSSSDLKKH